MGKFKRLPKKIYLRLLDEISFEISNNENVVLLLTFVVLSC
jgi:hypothetical protein